MGKPRESGEAAFLGLCFPINAYRSMPSTDTSLTSCKPSAQE